MGIAEGLQLSANAFNYEWEALQEWAVKEELTVEIAEELDRAVACVHYEMVVRPR